jgi:thiamine-phosphate pyrophosphorylase
MGLLVITPPTTTARELQCLPALFAAGLRTLHIRKPGGTRSEMQAYMNQVPKMYRNRLVLHDHHDLAAAGAGGIHFPERSLPAGLIAAPPGLTVSLSLHQLPQLGVCRGQVDYCFLAPIYASITKPGHCPPLELADRRALSDAVLTSCAPVIALGGATAACAKVSACCGLLL